MKYLLSLFAAALSICVIAISCSKSSNTYTSGPDRSVGMTSKSGWSGSSRGEVAGDTVRLPDTATIAWPKGFLRIITDTAFAVVKVNDFIVSVLGTWLNYRYTDSFINKVVVFDTLIAGSPIRTTLSYYYAKDSMSYTYYKQGAQNAATGIYYYVQDTLHTP